MASSLNMQRGGNERRIVVSLSGTYTAATDVNSSGPSQVFSAATLAARLADANDTQGASIAAGVLTINCGFAPNKVKVVNLTNRLIQEWFVGMNQGDFLEEIAAGDKTLETDDQVVVNLTTNVVTVLAAGGAITDNATVSVEIDG